MMKYSLFFAPKIYSSLINLRIENDILPEIMTIKIP